MKTSNKHVQIILLITLSTLPLILTHTIQPIASHPHNSNCYTQGLFFLNDTHVFQSCGLYNGSYFHVMQYQSKPFQLRNQYTTYIPWKPHIFLQGATLYKNHIYLLTWRQYVVYKLNPSTFEVVSQLKWNKQGWGLTTNGTHMFTTDGSDNIFIVDQNFKLISQKPITTQTGRRLYNINQLQYANGYIYANVYLDTKLVKIDFDKGKVIQQYDGIKLVQGQTTLQSDQVINGIAYDQKNDQFLVTGKHWDKIYQVKL